MRSRLRGPACKVCTSLLVPGPWACSTAAGRPLAGLHPPRPTPQLAGSHRIASSSFPVLYARARTTQVETKKRNSPRPMKEPRGGDCCRAEVTLWSHPLGSTLVQGQAQLLRLTLTLVSLSFSMRCDAECKSLSCTRCDCWC